MKTIISLFNNSKTVSKLKELFFHEQKCYETCDEDQLALWKKQIGKPIEDLKQAQMKPWDASLKSFAYWHSRSVSLWYSFSDHKADAAANADVSKVK